MESITHYPYIVYGEDWLKDAINFFKNHSYYEGDAGKFKPTDSNEYDVTINYNIVQVREDLTADGDQVMRLKAKRKKYELEADEIVLIFSKFDTYSFLNELYYFYADGAILKISYGLIVLNPNTNFITTRPLRTSFIRCPHTNPSAVTMRITK